MVADGVNVTVTGVDFLSLLFIDVADDDVTVVDVCGGNSWRVEVADDELSCDERTLIQTKGSCV